MAPGPKGAAVEVPADATTAWRYWQLSPRGLLRAVSHRRVEWPTGRPFRAACLGGGHQAPDQGCACGIYGAPDFDTLREHGLCLAPEPLVVGEVALWGTVLADDDGIRAEYGYPRTLSLVPETVPDSEVDVLTRGLAAYGVPVARVSLREAVAGVSAAMLEFQTMAQKASRTYVP